MYLWSRWRGGSGICQVILSIIIHVHYFLKKLLLKIDLISELAVYLRSKSQNPVLREDLSEILDVMRSIKLVKKYNIIKSLQFFSSSKTNEKCMKDLCAQIARRAEGKKPRLNVSLIMSNGSLVVKNAVNGLPNLGSRVEWRFGRPFRVSPLVPFNRYRMVLP